MSSKFSNLLSQARSRGGEDTEPALEDVISEKSTLTETTPAKQEVPEATQQRETPVRRTKTKTTVQPQAQTFTALEKGETVAGQGATRGRPRTGKRSDPNYTQITAYISKETHRAIKLALLQEANGSEVKEREISELIEEQLLSWLKKTH